MGADTDTARARKVWTWLDRNRAKLRDWRESEGLAGVEAAKAKDVHRYEVAGVKNSTEAEAALLLLADKGYLQAVDIRPPAGKAQRLFFMRPPDDARPIHPIHPTEPGLESGKSGKSGTPGAEDAPADPDEVNRLLAESADEDADAYEEGEL